MNKKKLPLQGVALTALLALSSWALADSTQYITLVNTTGNVWSATIGDTPPAGMDFTDVYIFQPTAPWGSSAGTTQVSTNVKGATVTFSSGNLNGIPLTVGTVPFNFASLPTTTVSGPLTLTLHGHSTGGSYGGDFTLIRSVPEPETYGMLLSGLAVLGFLARRRKQR